MDFQKRLLEIGKALSKEEVKTLAFLCTDLLGRNPASLESASDLFNRLVDQDHLSAEKPHLLAELLEIIQRKRLARDLELNGQSCRNLISPYRKLLYGLSEEITEQDLKDVKFLLNKRIPRRKLEENVTTLEVFLEMEHMDLISNTNLDLLETLIQSVCPVLKDKIVQFKAQQVPHSPVAQETCGPQSSSFEPTQVPQSFEMTFSSGQPELKLLAEPTTNASNTSMDTPNMSGRDQKSEAVSHGLSGLSIETNSCASFNVRNDALVMYPQKKETSSEKQLSQTPNTNTEVLGTYPMTAKTRGICLIINNYDFTKRGLPKREGTKIDEECLQKVFEWLGFQIKIERDCPRQKMLSVVKDLGSRDHSQMDCLVCCVLSHGTEGNVYGVDGDTISIRELMEPFSGLRCRSLVGKPKLFFIQACQGTDEQRPVYIEADSRTRHHVCSDAIVVKESIPSDADFLLGMATVPSFVSYRERKNGTWFIQSLCQNLVQLVPRHDLVSIMTKVNADVSQKTDTTGVKKQMPQPAFTLTKKVVFPKPRAPPPTL